MSLDNVSNEKKKADEVVPAAVAVPRQSEDESIEYDHLLPPQTPKDHGRKTLVLDLDETLIHSVFKPIENSDMIIKIPDVITDNEGNSYSLMNDIYVFKRPGVDMFLKRLSRYYELVIFTASIDKYANPVIDALDTSELCQHRLYREHCTFMYNVFIKDLTRLGRRMEDILILDNSPISYLFQKQNALPIKTWLEDRNDIELYKYLRLLEYLAKVDDVRPVITRIVDQDTNQIDFDMFDQIYNGKGIDLYLDSTNSTLVKEHGKRKKISSETRKLVNHRFGYSSMLEQSEMIGMRKTSKAKSKSKNKMDNESFLSKKSSKIGGKKSSKQTKSSSNTSNYLKKDSIDIKLSDYHTRGTEDSHGTSIVSAQYSAYPQRKAESTRTPIGISGKAKDLYVEVVGCELKGSESSIRVPRRRQLNENYTVKSPNLGTKPIQSKNKIQRKSASSLKPTTSISSTSKMNFIASQKNNWSHKDSVKIDAESNKCKSNF